MDMDKWGAMIGREGLNLKHSIKGGNARNLKMRILWSFILISSVFISLAEGQTRGRNFI